MHHFVKESRIAAPPGEVFAFHESPEAFERLIPPWEHVKLIKSSGSIRPGDPRRPEDEGRALSPRLGRRAHRVRARQALRRPAGSRALRLLVSPTHLPGRWRMGARSSATRSITALPWAGWATGWVGDSSRRSCERCSTIGMRPHDASSNPAISLGPAAGMTAIVDTPGGSPPGSRVVEAADPEIPPER